MISISVTELAVEHIYSVSPCPQLIGTVRVTNTSTVPVTVTTVVVGTNVITVSGGGVVVQPGAFVDLTVRFNCALAFSFTGQVKITGTPQGGQAVDKFVQVTGAVKVRAVRLAQALGSLAANSLIRQNRVTNWQFFAAHPPNCATDHLHSSSPGGILIDGLGPYPDPNQSGCGYGAIELVTLPMAP